jgi:hypothetical protein
MDARVKVLVSVMSDKHYAAASESSDAAVFLILKRGLRGQDPCTVLWFII